MPARLHASSCCCVIGWLIETVERNNCSQDLSWFLYFFFNYYLTGHIIWNETAVIFICIFGTYHPSVPLCSKERKHFHSWYLHQNDLDGQTSHSKTRSFDFVIFCWSVPLRVRLQEQNRSQEWSFHVYRRITIKGIHRKVWLVTWDSFKHQTPKLFYKDLQKSSDFHPFYIFHIYSQPHKEN